MVRKLVLGVLMLAAGLLTSPAGLRAAELLMFEDGYCSWCRRWHAEVGPSYPSSPAGRQAPLRRLDIGDQGTAGVSLARPVHATPTFVIVDRGQEVGRIVGYPGSDYFYPRVAEILTRLSPPAPSQATRGTAQTSIVCVQGKCDP
jgi:hypothetical protein